MLRTYMLTVDSNVEIAQFHRVSARDIRGDMHTLRICQAKEWRLPAPTLEMSIGELKAKYPNPPTQKKKRLTSVRMKIDTPIPFGHNPAWSY